MPSFTSPWATRRQIWYFVVVVSSVAIALAVPMFLFLYEPANCFDNKRNGREDGVDCGGSCALLCSHQVSAPVIRWTRSFKIRDGVYSALSYVENQNTAAGTEAISYKFEFYDSANRLISVREGRTYIPAESIVPVFEGRIELAREPARTFFSFTEEARWTRMTSRRGDLAVRNQVLQNTQSAPRLTADIENSSINTFNDVEVVAIVYDVRDNVAAISRTSLDSISKDQQLSVAFTWPEPFPTRVERCAVPANVALLMDISGSMNDDSTDPPQPLTDAKSAAAAFVDRMTASDSASVVSFATAAKLAQPLTGNLGDARRSLLALIIPPKEETGFTNIGEAIRVGREDLLNYREAGRDDNRQSSIILLTDGRANQPEDPGGEEYALEQARETRVRGIDIYTVGLGAGVNADFLRAIAADPDSSYRAVNSRELDGIYRRLSESLCERGPAIVDIIPLSRQMMIGI